ncbi:MAG: hypothetical protein HFF11_03805 [Angelakisella sp.]|jgi:hypothetical protein|nr:hypothetical protein [Angelakisella sp.]
MSQSNEYRRSAGDRYLESYPELRKWVLECPVCHRKGYRPDLPDRLGKTLKAQELRRYFQPMETDEMGFCTTCSRLRAKRERD